jgi:hypothetical protein
VRAWLVAAQLREKLQGDFGDSWFSQPEAAVLLRDLWREGRRYNARDLAEKLELPYGQVETLLQSFSTH